MSEKLLTHLDLIDDDGRIKNAAILLFGKKPQKFFISSEVKCIQFFGNKVERPLPAYQIYKGDVFELVDQATAFVMSRLNNWTGTRSKGDSASVPTHPELPMEAVQEAIVNAICHRDYRSNGSVQVMLFRNRLEIWNPGVLPFGLTIAKLYEDHKSIPANPLLAEPMYYKGYIEKAGTGTEDIVEKCLAYGLPKPQYQQDEDFRVVIYRPEAKEITSVTKSVTKPVTKSVTKPKQAKDLLIFCREPQPIADIMKHFDYSDRTFFKKNHLAPLLDAGLLEMTIPDKPTSSQQKYRITEKGLCFLNDNKDDTPS